MFDGDCSQAGRRAVMDKKRAAKEAYTGKIGDFRSSEQPSTNSMDSARSHQHGTPSGGGQSYRRPSGANAHSDIFGNYDSKSELGDGFKITNGSAAVSNSVPQTPSSAVSGIFTHRVNVKRHAYEVEVTCRLPIVDMAKNAKRRTITWIAENDEAHSVAIPAAFDLEDVSLISSELELGRCRVSVPAVIRNVLG